MSRVPFVIEHHSAFQLQRQFHIVPLNLLPTMTRLGGGGKVAPASAHEAGGSPGSTTSFFSQRSSSGEVATENGGATGFTPRGEDEAGPAAPRRGPQLVTTLVHEAGSFSSVHSSSQAGGGAGQALSRHELGTTQFVRTVVHRTVAKRSARRQAQRPHPAPPPTDPYSCARPHPSPPCTHCTIPLVRMTTVW